MVPAGELTSFYELRITLDEAQQLLHGEQAVTYANRSGAMLDEVHFVLRANLEAEPNPHLGSAVNAAGYVHGFDPAWTRIEGVADTDGRPLPFALQPALPLLQTWSLKDGFLVVHLPRPLAPGESTSFTIRFATRVPARQGDGGVIRGEYTWRFGWFPQERYRDPAGQGWSTGDVLSGFRYRLDLALPARLQAAVGADWCEERLQGEQRIVRCGSQVPVRSIPLLLSDRWVRRTARADGIEITVLAQPDGDIFDRSATEAETFLQLVRGMLAFFGKSYGPYRLRRLIIAETPVSGMSMAADGMLLLTDLFWIYNATWLAWGIFDPVAEATLAHELAHLWWGIGVGADLDRHNWLSEAFAQYLSFRWMTSAHGARADTGLRPNGFVRWLVGSTSEIKLPRRQVEEQILPDYRYLVEDGRDGKISEPMARQKDLATLEALYYEKGYLVLRALELFMPEPTVRQVLREVHRRYAGEVATIDDFQRVAEEVSGVELDRLFAGWVHGTASGDYAVEDLKVFKIKSGGYRSRIAVRYRGSGALPVPLLVTDEEQRETVVIWDPVEGAGEVEVDTAAFPETIALDPQGLAPDTMRRNNFYPRQSTFSWLLARNDPEAYVVSLKPTRFSSFGTIGPAIGGNYLDDHQWWIGAGLGGSTGPLGDDDGSGESSGAGGEASDELATRLGAYAESAWRLSRSHALTAGAGASTAASGKARRYDAQGLLGWQYTRFSSPELGLSAPLLLPVLQLLVGAGPHWTRDEGSEPQEVASGELSLALLRDDTPTLGLSQRLSLTGGGYARDGLRRYGIARYDLAHLASLGRPSYLATQLAAGVQSSSTPSSWRFVPDLSPAAMVVGDPPRGAWMAQGSLRYTLPLLRQLRIKNPLTLWLFVFNGLDLDLQYAAAWLAPPGYPPQQELALVQGEAFAGLTGHLALFDGSSFGLRLGWSTPVAPAAWDPAAGRLTVDLVMLPHAL